MDKAVEAALDAWYAGEDWRRGLGLIPGVVAGAKHDMRAAITAADAARAVTDEEVLIEDIISKVGIEIWMNGGPDIKMHHAAAGARGMLYALHAAGFKVIRNV